MIAPLQVLAGADSTPVATLSTPTFLSSVGQNPNRLESSDTYYALFVRRGKQIRDSKSVVPRKARDRWALARKRLNDMREKVAP